LFDSADKNGDGTLDLKEVLQMMKTLNVGVSKKVVKKMFKVRQGSLPWVLSVLYSRTRMKIQ
jgi:Ca2+-binding EF-hand superfamily protein